MTQKPIFMEGVFTLRNLRSMGAAAITEILIACGIAGILVWHQLQTHAQPPPVIGTVIPESPPVTPQLQRTEATPQRPERPALSQVPPVREAIPTPTALPVQPLQPPSLQARQSPPADVVDEFAAQMLQAIDAAKIYPHDALLKGKSGEVVVSFDYVDGVVSGIHVDRSSGYSELDAAAVQAVQRAVLPTKPAQLAGLNRFVFHLVFDLGR